MRTAKSSQQTTMAVNAILSSYEIFICPSNSKFIVAPQHSLVERQEQKKNQPSNIKANSSRRFLTDELTKGERYSHKASTVNKATTTTATRVEIKLLPSGKNEQYAVLLQATNRARQKTMAAKTQFHSSYEPYDGRAHSGSIILPRLPLNFLSAWHCSSPMKTDIIIIYIMRESMMIMNGGWANRFYFHHLLRGESGMRFRRPSTHPPIWRYSPLRCVVFLSILLCS